MMIDILRAKLVNDEAALLMKINKNKNIAKMNAKEGMIQKFLEQVFYITESIGYLFVFNLCMSRGSHITFLLAGSVGS